MRSGESPPSKFWLLGVLVIGLLIAFPYHVLGAVGLAVLISLFIAKK